MKFQYLVGVDEAGRGPLAGPVAVGVAVVPTSFDWELLREVDDSKKLSERKREEIFTLAQDLKREGALNYRVSMVSAPVIDRVGIARAVAMATARAMHSLSLSPEEVHVKLDGLLRAPSKFVSQETIVGGDGKERIIGLASVISKVTRDRYMVRAGSLPELSDYAFHIHKGYGTKKHREVLRARGLSEMHRSSYCRNILK